MRSQLSQAISAKHDALRIQELRDELAALAAEGASPRCDQAIRATERLARYLGITTDELAAQEAISCEFCSNPATTTAWQEALGAGSYSAPCCKPCKDLSL